MTSNDRDMNNTQSLVHDDYDGDNDDDDDNEDDDDEDDDDDDEDDLSDLPDFPDLAEDGATIGGDLNQVDGLEELRGDNMQINHDRGGGGGGGGGGG